MKHRVRRLEQQLTPSEPTTVTIRRRVVSRNPETGNLEVVRVVERTVRFEGSFLRIKNSKSLGAE